jgi:hypothetical protein
MFHSSNHACSQGLDPGPWEHIHGMQMELGGTQMEHTACIERQLSGALRDFVFYYENTCFFVGGGIWQHGKYSYGLWQ